MHGAAVATEHQVGEREAGHQFGQGAGDARRAAGCAPPPRATRASAGVSALVRTAIRRSASAQPIRASTTAQISSVTLSAPRWLQRSPSQPKNMVAGMAINWKASEYISTCCTLRPNVVLKKIAAKKMTVTMASLSR